MENKTQLFFKGKAEDFRSFIESLKMRGYETIGDLFTDAHRQAVNKYHQEEFFSGCGI